MRIQCDRAGRPRPVSAAAISLNFLRTMGVRLCLLLACAAAAAGALAGASRALRCMRRWSLPRAGACPAVVRRRG